MTISVSDINVTMYGQFVTFNVFPTNLIPTTFTNVKVLSVVDYRTASRIKRDLAALHAEVYPTIPTLVRPPNDATAYNYLVVELPGGQSEVLGIPWIDLTSFSVVEYIQLNGQFTGIGNDDVTTIKEAIAALGFGNNVSWQVVTSG